MKDWETPVAFYGRVGPNLVPLFPAACLQSLGTPGCWQHSWCVSLHLPSLQTVSTVCCDMYLVFITFSPDCMLLSWMDVSQFPNPTLPSFPCTNSVSTCRAHSSQLQTSAPCFPVSLTHFSAEADLLFLVLSMGTMLLWPECKHFLPPANSHARSSRASCTRLGKE